MSKPKVFFVITIGGKPAGRIVMELRVSAAGSRGTERGLIGRCARAPRARRPPPAHAAALRICSRTLLTDISLCCSRCCTCFRCNRLMSCPRLPVSGRGRTEQRQRERPEAENPGAGTGEGRGGRAAGARGRSLEAEGHGGQSAAEEDGKEAGANHGRTAACRLCIRRLRALSVSSLIWLAPFCRCFSFLFSHKHSDHRLILLFFILP